MMSDLVTLADFRSSLAELSALEAEYAIIGGLAVGQWAEALLLPAEKRFFAIPIRSKDIDLRSSKDVATAFVLALKASGARPKTLVKRNPKDWSKAFPSIAIPVTLTRGTETVETTVEALSALPLLDQFVDGEIIFHGTALRYGDLYLLDPCSLLVCKLNALQTRPPGESENDKVHAEILSLIIPRFISKALQRHREKGDPYHPGADATHLLSFLQRPPWDALLPLEQKNAVVDACAQVQTPAPNDAGITG